MDFKFGTKISLGLNSNFCEVVKVPSSGEIKKILKIFQINNLVMSRFFAMACIIRKSSTTLKSNTAFVSQPRDKVSMKNEKSTVELTSKDVRAKHVRGC